MGKEGSAAAVISLALLDRLSSLSSKGREGGREGRLSRQEEMIEEKAQEGGREGGREERGREGGMANRTKNPRTYLSNDPPTATAPRLQTDSDAASKG